MAARYTADGKRKSSMTHARRGHRCSLCGALSFGNGGLVSHARAHVRRGEAVELVRWYPGQPSPSRMFIAAGDSARIGELRDIGYREPSLAPWGR